LKIRTDIHFATVPKVNAPSDTGKESAILMFQSRDGTGVYAEILNSLSIQPWLEIIRWWCGEMEFFPGGWVVKGELPGVEEQARDGDFVFFPVDRITEDWSTDVVHMDADLVGTAGV
jgi:hypothetical protein